MINKIKRHNIFDYNIRLECYVRMANLHIKTDTVRFEHHLCILFRINNAQNADRWCGFFFSNKFADQKTTLGVNRMMVNIRIRTFSQTSNVFVCNHWFWRRYTNNIACDVNKSPSILNTYNCNASVWIVRKSAIATESNAANVSMTCTAFPTIIIGVHGAAHRHMKRKAPNLWPCERTAACWI